MEVYPTMITSASEKPGNMKRIQWQSSVLLPHYFLCEIHTHAYGMLHMLTFFFHFWVNYAFQFTCIHFCNKQHWPVANLSLGSAVQSGFRFWTLGPGSFPLLPFLCLRAVILENRPPVLAKYMFNNNDKTHVYMKSLFATDKRDNSVFLHFQNLI